jgi:hypothetical protein
MIPAGFEPVIPASQRPQTHVSECAATGIGVVKFPNSNFMLLFSLLLRNGVQDTKVDDLEKCQIYILYVYSLASTIILDLKVSSVPLYFFHTLCIPGTEFNTKKVYKYRQGSTQ